MPQIGEILNENFEVPNYKVSDKFWNRVNQTENETYEITEAEKEYWKRVGEQTDLKLNRVQQKAAFNESYKLCLRVGERISEAEYFERTKNDIELTELINKLIDWYFLNSDFKKGGFLIYSPPGVGKTSVIKTLNHIALRFANKTNRGEIEYHEIGEMLRNNNLGIKVDFGFYSKNHVIIDDLSVKVNFSNSFGNKFSLGDIFENRYSLWQGSGFCTIITTNLLPFKAEGVQSLEDLLTERAIDRIRQQYEIILLTGESKRNG
jgi:DNA replication protein DnaC